MADARIGLIYSDVGGGVPDAPQAPLRGVTPHSVGRCRAATEGLGHVSGVSRRLTEGWPFSRKTSVIALSQRLPCVKGAVAA